MIFTPASHRFSFGVKVGPSCASVERAWGKESKCCGHKALKACTWITLINHRLIADSIPVRNFFPFAVVISIFFGLHSRFYRPEWDFHSMLREILA